MQIHAHVRLALSFTLLAVMAASAVAESTVGESTTGESPQFRGPDRSGVFPSKGLLKSWPEGGPKQLWSFSGLGEGYASVAVAGGRVYTTGASGGTGSVFAIDTAGGKLLWRTGYGAVHDGSGYPGSRTTPTVDDGMVYIMSSMGKAAAFDAATGKIGWQKDLPNRQIRWGITESPLVVDDLAVFTPGGAATMVALDKKTGAQKWAMTELSEPSAYCSPRLFDDGRRRQIITLTKGHLIGVDPASGELLWRQRYPGRYDIHAVSPVFAGGSIYVSDGYGQGGKMFDLAGDGRSVSLAWEEDDLDVHHGGAVVVRGVIYGAADNGTWHALDAGSGDTKATIRRLGKGSVIYADGRLYGYTEKGKVVLVDPDPGNFAAVSELKITQGDGQHWAHPVIAGSVLYIRHGDVLMAFDIGA